MEAIGEITKRIVERARDRRAAMDREQRKDDMPGVQSHATEEKRSVFECDGHGGRDSLALLALSKSGRSIL